MTRPKRIYAVVWTWREHKILATKKACREHMREWKTKYEAAGADVRACGQDAYVATFESGEKHAIVLHEYDAETKERVYPVVRPAKPKAEKPSEPRVRRGRVPAYA